jgi:hypothetical protein
MDRLLRGALARYSAGESPGEPSREHYAAARRWLACAREAAKWVERSAPGARSEWLLRVSEATAKAREHRAMARRWRVGSRGMTMSYCASCDAPIEDGEFCAECEPDAETRTLELRAAARIERRRAIEAYFAAARQTLKLVRIYRDEPGTTGRREREALDEVRRFRAAIGDLRAADRRARDAPLPGVKKTMSGEPASERKRAG